MRPASAPTAQPSTGAASASWLHRCSSPRWPPTSASTRRRRRSPTRFRCSARRCGPRSLVTAAFRRPDWAVLPAAITGAIFLLSLVLAASMMPVERLPARVVADGARPRLRLGGVRQHPADRAGAAAGRLRLGHARLRGRLRRLDDLVRLVGRRRGHQRVPRGASRWPLAAAWLARRAGLRRRLRRADGDSRLAAASAPHSRNRRAGSRRRATEGGASDWRRRRARARRAQVTLPRAPRPGRSARQDYRDLGPSTPTRRRRAPASARCRLRRRPAARGR